MSPAYEKASSKNPILPKVNDRVTAENAFKKLPLSLLALRVSKVDADHAHDGHNHAKAKRVKGLWTVRIEQHQEANDECYYIWLYEGSQWKQKLYAVGALVGILAVVLFPLWPMKLRLGVWYLSMGMLGLIGLFFAMAIFRLILFIITMFATPPGLWLYPNLFEDVGFFDSFRPVWAWQEVRIHYNYVHAGKLALTPHRLPTTSRTRSAQRRRRRPPKPPPKPPARLSTASPQKAERQSPAPQHPSPKPNLKLRLPPPSPPPSQQSPHRSPQAQKLRPQAAPSRSGRRARQSKRPRTTSRTRGLVRVVGSLCVQASGAGVRSVGRNQEFGPGTTTPHPHCRGVWDALPVVFYLRARVRETRALNRECEIFCRVYIPGWFEYLDF